MISARELFFIAARWRESQPVGTPRRVESALIEEAFAAFQADVPESFPLTATRPITAGQQQVVS